MLSSRQRDASSRPGGGEVFFYLSKIFWTFAQPVSLIGILLFVSIVAAFLNRRRLSLSASVAAFLLLALFGWTTFGALLLQPLESRFARPAEMPQAVDGIIVLGGAFEGGINPSAAFTSCPKLRTG